MKKILLAITLLLSLGAFAQNKITIACKFIGLKKTPIDYGLLDKLLPDSLRSSIIINPYKEYGMKNQSVVFLWLLSNGWKLETDISNGKFAPDYLFTRDIYLDDAALAIYREKLIEAGKHP